MTKLNEETLNIFDPEDHSMLKLVKVSAKSMRLRFHGCEPTFIRDVCHGRCCEGPTQPLGVLISITPTETAAIEAAGGRVNQGLLMPKPGTRLCPFKTDAHLCALHDSGIKPINCIVDPFTLNRCDTLIVRNRYKLYPCYDAGPRLPAYKAFPRALQRLFGDEMALRLTLYLDDDASGDITLPIRRQVYDALKQNDLAKHAGRNPRPEKTHEPPSA